MSTNCLAFEGWRAWAREARRTRLVTVRVVHRMGSRAGFGVLGVAGECGVFFAAEGQAALAVVIAALANTGNEDQSDD